MVKEHIFWEAAATTVLPIFDKKIDDTTTEPSVKGEKTGTPTFLARHILDGHILAYC